MQVLYDLEVTIDMGKNLVEKILQAHRISGEVRQEETLMRMAVLPCQTVPPHQHVPSS